MSGPLLRCVCPLETPLEGHLIPMKSFRSSSLQILVIMFAVTSCAGPTKWRNPDVPRQRWAVDRAACESKARRKLDKERSMENMLKAGDDAGSASSYEKNMSVYMDRKRLALISGNCLKKLGYEVIP